MKQCIKCSLSFPATPEFFSRDRTKQDGLHTICKACEKARHKAYRETHLEQEKAHKKLYREAHREQIAASKKLWQQGESYKAYQRRYHQEHLEEMHKYQRQCYQADRHQRLERQRHYLQTEQGRLVDRTHRHKRKAQKRACEGSYTPRQLQEQLKRQKARCYYCKGKLSEQWHVDHVIPLSRGGSNDISNIVVACPACNLSKQAKLPHEWPEGNRLL